MGATSLLDFLTCPNPPVSHTPSKKKRPTFTASATYYSPKRIQSWCELKDPSILETSFARKLLPEARKPRTPTLQYPTLHPTADCILPAKRNGEDKVRDVYNKWTSSILNDALAAVEQVFRPAIWCQGDPPTGEDVFEMPQRSRSARVTNQNRGKDVSPRTPAKGKTLYLKLRPDAGSCSPVLVADDSGDPGSFQVKYGPERFPKEYKTYQNWSFDKVQEYNLFKSDGTWMDGMETHAYAWPIRQAYTYSVRFGCRYGCLLTCHEAFIFRIKPLSRGSSSLTVLNNNENQSTTQPQALGDESNTSGLDKNSLKEELRYNGLMEYITVPWKNSWEANKDNSREWTINLVLWYLHILAGNNYKIDWTYLDLANEDVVPPEQEVELSNEAEAQEAQGHDAGPSQESTRSTILRTTAQIEPIIEARLALKVRKRPRRATEDESSLLQHADEEGADSASDRSETSNATVSDSGLGIELSPTKKRKRNDDPDALQLSFYQSSQ